MIEPADEAAVHAQLGRPPRAIHGVAHRCPCGNPDVVATEPRLPDGTPFPTTYYLTCPRAASLIGTLEGSGLMKEMQDRLADDAELAAAYRAAHEAYLADRATPRRRARDRRRLGRRHARPREVPARARRPRAGRRPRRQPARRRGARAPRRLVGRRTLCRASSDRPDRRHRLRHQHDQAADRLAAARRAGPRVDGWCGSGRASTAPAGSPTRRWRGPSRRSTSTPRCCREHGVERLRFCATSATRDAANADAVRRRCRASGWASGPEVLSRRRGGRALVRRRRPQPACRARRRRCWWSTSAAARPS